MLKHLRTIVGKILRPIAAFFLKLGLTPDVVTIIGTLGAMVGSLVFITCDHENATMPSSSCGLPSWPVKVSG